MAEETSVEKVIAVDSQAVEQAEAAVESVEATSSGENVQNVNSETLKPKEEGLSIEERLKKMEEEKELLRQELEEVKRVKAQVPPVQEPKQENPLAQYSDDQLLEYKEQYPEYARKIEKELLSRHEDRAFKRADEKIQAQNQRLQYAQQAQTQWADLRDPKSEHSRITQQIMDSDPNYLNHPAGYFVAAQAARTQILENQLKQAKKSETSAEIKAKQAQLEKQKADSQTQLNGVNRVTNEPTVNDELSKSFDGLTGVRPGTPDFLAHMRLLNKRKSKAAQ